MTEELNLQVTVTIVAIVVTVDERRKWAKEVKSKEINSGKTRIIYTKKPLGQLNSQVDNHKTFLGAAQYWG